MQRLGRCLSVVLLATFVVACTPTDEPSWQVWLSDRPVGRASEALTPWPDGVRSLTFAITPYDDRRVLEQSFGPLLRFIGKRIGVPIEVDLPEDYEGVVRGLADGSYDAALGTPMSYVELRDHIPGVHLLASQVAEGSTSYIGYVYCRAERPFRTLSDLQGASFCYVDPRSTSGYLYPRAMLRKAGYDPDAFFGRVEFGGNHTTCLRKVLTGKVDAAAISSGAVATARREDQPLHQIRVLAKTPRIPYDAWVAAPDMPDAAVRRLREELLAISTRSSAGRLILRGPIRLNAWIVVGDSHYDSVREALRLSGDAR